MPSGEVHYKYYMGGWWAIIPGSCLLALWDWKFALGNCIGFFMGRYCDP